MNPLSALQSSAMLGADLAADSRALDGLKREARGDPRQAIKAAARQFEAMFMQLVLKSMREATPKSGLLDSAAGDLYNGMLDQQLAGAGTGRSGGLAAIIERQLARHLPGAAAAEAAQRRPVSLSTPAAPAASARTEPARSAANGDEAQRPANGPDRATAQSVFVNRMWDHALAAQRDTGLPAKFIIGQAALESGWGSREIVDAQGTRSFNLFGIKAGSGWPGRTVEAVTTEYENGVAVRKVEKFRAYNSYAESFRDWARLLAGNPRYAQVLANGADAAGFAQGLQRAGYATDPNYGAKLLRVIETAQALRGLS